MTTAIEKPIAEAPPLRDGDRLTRDEFERRYEAMPHIKQAELIEGVVYMPSPLRLRKHGQPNSELTTWLTVYRASTPGLIGGIAATVRLDLNNEPQPDDLLMIEPGFGGQAIVDDDDFVAGAPELVAEIAASSIDRDLNVKLHVYRRNGVREYIVWRVPDRIIDWLILRQSVYQPLLPTVAGVYQSEVFPGLWLDRTAMIEGDMKKVLQVLQDGINSPEHAAFVERLARSNRSKG